MSRPPFDEREAYPWPERDQLSAEGEAEERRPAMLELGLICAIIVLSFVVGARAIREELRREANAATPASRPCAATPEPAPVSDAGRANPATARKPGPVARPQAAKR